jgi:hypothetical protein
LSRLPQLEVASQEPPRALRSDKTSSIIYQQKGRTNGSTEREQDTR